MIHKDTCSSKWVEIENCAKKNTVSQKRSKYALFKAWHKQNGLCKNGGPLSGMRSLTFWVHTFSANSTSCLHLKSHA